MKLHPRPFTAGDIPSKCFVSGASLNTSSGRCGVCLNGLQHKMSLFVQQPQKEQLETWLLITAQEGLCQKETKTSQQHEEKGMLLPQ